MTEPDPERIRSAVETIASELGDVGHLEIYHYEFDNGERYTNLYCPENIPGVEESPQNKYRLADVRLEERSTASLVPANR